jgi:regulator of nonsense transcripts 2
MARGGKWEDEEERRFFEDILDLKDYIPKGVLGIEGDEESDSEDTKEARQQKEKERVEAEVRKLDEELADLEVSDKGQTIPSDEPRANGDDEDDAEEDG